MTAQRSSAPTLTSSREKFETALREYLSEKTEGGYLTDYMLVTAYSSPRQPGSQSWYAVSDYLPRHIGRGLLIELDYAFAELYENV